jgi:uncharacterized protein YcbX
VTTLHVPRAGDVVAGTADADAAVSGLLERPVRLVTEAGGVHYLRRAWPTERGLVPGWQRSARPGEDAITEMAGTSVHRSFVDYGAVHIVTTAQVDAFAKETGSAVDVARFRPNLVLDGARSRLSPGDRISIGAVRLRVELPTPRCAVPGLSPVDVSTDRHLLRALARFDRRRVGTLGTAACFGVYALVEQEGVIAEGAHVTVE